MMMQVLACLGMVLCALGFGLALLLYDLSAIYGIVLAGLFLAIGALGLLYPLFDRRKSPEGDD